MNIISSSIVVREFRLVNSGLLVNSRKKSKDVCQEERVYLLDFKFYSCEV